MKSPAFASLLPFLFLLACSPGAAGPAGPGPDGSARGDALFDGAVADGGDSLAPEQDAGGDWAAVFDQAPRPDVPATPDRVADSSAEGAGPPGDLSPDDGAEGPPNDLADIERPDTAGSGDASACGECDAAVARADAESVAVADVPSAAEAGSELDGPPDATPPDAGPLDVAPFDVAPFDVAPFDAGPPDGAPFDAAPFDAGPPDGAPFDTAPLSDTQPADAAPTPDALPADAAPPPDALPADAAPDAEVSPPEPPPALRISEALSDNEETLADEDGDYPDWLELYNADRRTVELAGWGLSDDPRDPFQWTFPSYALLPGQFVVVFASGKNRAGPEPPWHTPFRLDRDGDVLFLTAPNGATADALVLPALAADVAYGLSQQVETVTPLGAGTPGRFWAEPPPAWWQPDFDDGAWPAVALAIGFDRSIAPGDPVNAALLAVTDQSSDGYGFTGLQAVDGEPATFSHTADGDMQPWWQVDLPADYAIQAIRLFNRLDCCAERLYNLTVEVRDAADQVVWTSPVLNPVAADEAPTSPGDQLSLDLAEAVIGRKVRVVKQAVGGLHGSEWLSLAEVVVEGRLAAPYAARITTDVGPLLYGVSAVAALRAPFTASLAEPDRALLTVHNDDGFIAWLDGQEVARARAGDTAATEAHDAAEAETFPIDPALLAEGEHGLALAGFNRAADDDDFLLGAELHIQRIESGAAAYFAVPTPGAPNGVGVAGFVAAPTLVPPRGFYDAALSVDVRCATPGAMLVYTLDGSAPSETNGVQVPAPAPDVPPVANLPLASTSLLRVRALRPGYEPSPTVTHSYLFLQDVIRQPADPPGFPTQWLGQGQPAIAADYAMDPDIVDDPAYHDDLLAGLRAIPTLSLVMDPDDLFGPERGIYIHSLQRGDEWERPTSVELILPDGTTGFQHECGVRIHGYGWRAHSVSTKHSFRLEFSKRYGPAKLEYPWFADAPVARFDSIVLRSQGSRGWQDFRDPEQAQYLHDAFARDTARDMGKVDGHATFVHLYLNGLYWGLYNPVERPDADFGAEYFGGSADEYDAINRRTTTNEAIDGDLTAYNELLALADEDPTDPQVYAAIEQYLDIDDLIDYMLIQQYTVNRDGPCCFQHNNMRGVRRRQPGAPFRFFVWDMEYSLWQATDATNIDVDIPGAISHVYARLRANPAFRQRYSDRARQHLAPGGALSAAACTARWQARAAEIYLAVVGESARWGDAKREPPYTRDVEWAAERERLLTEFFPYRSDILAEQLQQAGLLVP